MPAPLNVLLSHALLDLTRACERAGTDEVVLWSNLLRVVSDDGVALATLPMLTRLSRRAVKTHVDGMERGGWASVDDGIVGLTHVAREARDHWAVAIADAESHWPGTSSLRGALEALVAEQELEHPHYPCGYGAADWRITGGGGDAWKAVPRDQDADTVSTLPVLALLSQAVVAFAMAYEEQASAPLLVGVHFDASFADGGMPLRDAPAALMIAGTGRSSLERHRFVIVDRWKRVALTARGHEVRESYRRLVEAIESSWTAAPALRKALEQLDVHRAGHADHPDVRFVGGHVGFAEVSARRS